MDQVKSTKTVEYKLLKPITFHKAGKSEEATFLFLKAPSRKLSKKTRFLKQTFFRAVKGMGNNPDAKASEGSDSDKDISGKDVTMMLLMSDIDISDCLDSLKIILTGGGAEIDDGVVLSAHSYDQLTESDEELLLGEYLANFLLIFWMKELSQK